MRVVVIGLGSMGRRRIRLMQAMVDAPEIVGVNRSVDRRVQAEKEFGIRTFATLAEAIAAAQPQELHLDYFGRFARRQIELFTEEDVIVCDFLKSEARSLRSGETVDLSESRDSYCRREEEYFLDFALGGKANMNSISHANEIIRFLEG